MLLSLVMHETSPCRCMRLENQAVQAAGSEPGATVHESFSHLGLVHVLECAGAAASVQAPRQV